MAGKKKRDTSAAEKELDRCRQAARMLRGTENVAVIDSLCSRIKIIFFRHIN